MAIVISIHSSIAISPLELAQHNMHKHGDSPRNVIGFVGSIVVPKHRTTDGETCLVTEHDRGFPLADPKFLNGALIWIRAATLACRWFDAGPVRVSDWIATLVRHEPLLTTLTCRLGVLKTVLRVYGVGERCHKFFFFMLKHWRFVPLPIVIHEIKLGQPVRK